MLPRDAISGQFGYDFGPNTVHDIELRASEPHARPPASEEEAAVLIQKLLRARMARRAVRKVASGVFEKIYDPESNSYYYWNLKTNEPSWTKPRVLGPDDAPLALDLDGSKPSPREARRTPRPIHSEEDAVLRVQGLYRCWKARQRVRSVAKSVYEKLWDEENQTYYYW